MTVQSAPSGLASITPRQWLVLVMVQITTLLFGMTQTLANVVLPQIKGTMSATQDQVAWIVTFNIVATAIATPMVGWLANRFGWRNTLLTAMIGFTFFSMMCGLAHDLESLILYRIGQGLFGAPLAPMGQGILIATFPRHLHALVLMLWGTGAVFGPILGPVLGAMMAETYDWRVAFFIIVPPGLIGILLVWIALADRTETRSQRFDWTGFLALAVAIACAQLVLDRGQRLDWFESTEIVIETIIGLIAFWIFVVHCLTARDPFFDPRLLQDRNYAMGLITITVMGMLMFTPMVLFPGLLADLKGYPEGLIGTLLAGRGLGNFVSFAIVVQATRWNARASLAIGLAIQALSGYAMAQLDLNMTQFDVFWTNFVQGFGFGLAFTPMSVLAFATLPTHRVTEGMAFFHLLRNFGSSLFIALSFVLLIRSTAENYATMSEKISPFNRTLSDPSIVGEWSMNTLGGLVTLSGEIHRQAAMIGYINAFYFFTLAATLAIPIAWAMREPKN